MMKTMRKRTRIRKKIPVMTGTILLGMVIMISDDFSVPCSKTVMMISNKKANPTIYPLHTHPNFSRINSNFC